MLHTEPMAAVVPVLASYLEASVLVELVAGVMVAADLAMVALVMTQPAGTAVDHWTEVKGAAGVSSSALGPASEIWEVHSSGTGVRTVAD